jgi:hypothetical protein
MKTTRTRAEVVDECADAVAACWNHYGSHEKPLTGDQISRIRRVLDDNLPVRLNTKNWETSAKAQKERYDSEPDEETKEKKATSLADGYCTGEDMDAMHDALDEIFGK